MKASLAVSVLMFLAITLSGCGGTAPNEELGCPSGRSYTYLVSDNGSWDTHLKCPCFSQMDIPAADLIVSQATTQEALTANWMSFCSTQNGFSGK